MDVGMNGGKWKHWNVNIRFLKELEAAVGHNVFTNKEAYNVYAVKCKKIGSMDNWAQMNVRNTLCASAAWGILERVDKGAYRFPVR
jgi:hypothetical protein